MGVAAEDATITATELSWEERAATRLDAAEDTITELRREIAILKDGRCVSCMEPCNPLHPKCACIRAEIAEMEAEIAALKGAQRTLDWLDEGWEFPCPSCGGGCYRSRALEKQHCYACGAAFPPEVLRMLAGKEAQR